MSHTSSHIKGGEAGQPQRSNSTSQAEIELSSKEASYSSNTSSKQRRISSKKMPPSKTEELNLEILVGIQENGLEVARRYTSVAREENTDISRSSNFKESKLVQPPVRVSEGEVGGTGSGSVEASPKEEQKGSAAHELQISKVEDGEDVRLCEKDSCRLRAFGKCEWRNPCSQPVKEGGCGKYFCELHGANFDNFRRFQCCTDCKIVFNKHRHCRRMARLYILIFNLILALAGAIAVGVILSEEQSNSLVPSGARPTYLERQVAAILDGTEPMNSDFSQVWGKLALEATNKERESQSLESLQWSDDMHTVAYNLCKEIATGVIPFGKSNFMNLLSQTISFYEPDSSVDSLAEQMAKIVDANPQQDFIAEWKRAWTIDHLTDVYGDFTDSVAGFYFIAETKEVIVIQLFGLISENTSD